MHYYVEDKTELILHCVRAYKATCVTRYDAVVADAVTAQDLCDGFADKLVETLVDEAPMHRPVDPGTAYSLLDGDFEKALLGLLSGQADALETLRTRARTVLAMLLGQPAEAT